MPLQLRELLMQLLYLGDGSHNSSELKKQIGRGLRIRRLMRVMPITEMPELSYERAVAVENGEAPLTEIMAYWEYVK